MLTSKIHTCYQAALSQNLIHFLESQSITLVDSQLNINYDVLLAPSLLKKPSDTAKPVRDKKMNPFLPYDPAMCVSEISSTHVLLLNKFPMVPNHVLLVTTEFQPQHDLLTISDFDALLKVMGGISDSKPLGFYNCGEKSGSSQPHRHFQFIPNYSFPPLIEFMKTGGPNTIPYLHQFTPTKLLEHTPTSLYELYLQHMQPFLEAMPRSEWSGPIFHHNLLVTLEWILIIPRSRCKSGVFNLNAVAYTGAIVVVSMEQVEQLKRMENGLYSLLRECGIMR